jgi:hypothetical protein
MSLDHKGTGNPDWKPGVAQNPQGRPKGSLSSKSTHKVKERLLGKWKTHPVDKLVTIANFLTASGISENMIEAATIWTNLLKYFEPTKKPVEITPEKSTPEESAAAAEETYKLLEELENAGLSQITSSKGNGVETGQTPVSLETSSKEDLSGHKE